MAKPRLRAYPKNGPITIADGEIYKIGRGGNFIRIKNASSEFTLRLDDGMEMPSVQNDVFRMTDGDFFGSVEVVNDTGGDLTFQLQIGQGAVETNNISISGDINIKNASTPNDELQIKTKSGTVIKTDDDGTQSKLDDVITAIGSQADYNNVGAESAVRFTASVSVVNTIFTPAENVNGAVIRFLNVSGNAAGYRKTVYADTSAPSSETDGTKNAFISDLADISVTEPFLVPAGKGLYVTVNSAIYAYYAISWDYL